MSREFNETSTCDDVLSALDLSGQHALITGASGGLGAEAARAMAMRGCAVTIAARDVQKAEVVAASIREANPSAQIDIGQLELADQDSINAFADNWLKDHKQLDMLILNAGVMACPLTRTAQGWESQFATNHLGHFLLTSRLVKTLENSANEKQAARVVVLSSRGHQISPVLFDDIQFDKTDYEPWVAYGQSKTANALFASELDRRFSGKGVRAFAVHPGVIMTDLSRHLSKEAIEQLAKQMEGGAEALKDIPKGAATEVWAATAPELEGQGGLYLSDCQVVPADREGPMGYADYALATEPAAKLWALSEQLLNISFD